MSSAGAPGAHQGAGRVAAQSPVPGAAVERDFPPGLAEVSPPVVVQPDSTAAVTPVGALRDDDGRRFRVLKVAPTSFFSDYGCHVRIYEESVALQRLGNEVEICTYASGKDVPNLTVRRVSGNQEANPRIGPSRRKVLFDLALAGLVLRENARFRPDVIHAHLHEGAAIGWLANAFHRRPMVFDFQGSMTSEMVDHQWLRRGSRRYRSLRRLESIINRFPNAIITSSSNAADVLHHEFRYPRSRIFVMADSVDTNRFLPRWELPDMSVVAEQKAELRLPVDRRIVVYLGLLAPYQGIDVMLMAARKLRDEHVPVHFLIMGYPNVDAYVEQAASLGVSGMVTFTGRVDYFDAPRRLVMGDIGISPKISETEGNGKLLNYIACGLPTVAFDTPVAREILGQDGVFAPRQDVDGLAASIRWLVEHDEERQGMGRRLRQRAVERYDWASAARGMMDLYGSLR